MQTNPYSKLVHDYARLFREGHSWPLGGFVPSKEVGVSHDAPKALIFSPHPDDECIVGGLALRLRRETQWNVINVAVTQGSNPARQMARWEELQSACHFLGFGLIPTAPTGLERVNPKTREGDSVAWKMMVTEMARILSNHQPRVIFFPHAQDWNSTHIGTYFLVRDALETLGPSFETFCVETEYWGQMTTPNLMAEISPIDLCDLVTALSFHAGEVQRNPFHLVLPAWMHDNVRRGSELVGGQGEAAPGFTFATLYRLQRWSNGSMHRCLKRGLSFPSTGNAKDLINLFS